MNELLKERRAKNVEFKALLGEIVDVLAEIGKKLD